MRKRLYPYAVGLLILVAGCGSVQDEPKDEASFTQDVAERLRKEVEGTVRVSAPRTLEIGRPDGTTSTVSLDNLWRDCSLRPEDCSDSVERFVRAISQHRKADLGLSREAVRATVRSKAWLDEFAKAGETPVARHLVGDLWKVYVFDLPDSMAGVRQKDLENLNITEEELDSLALANLENAITDFPHEPLEESSPIRVLHTGDSYEASRLLLHPRWRELAQGVEGDLLVSVPSRDYVLFVGSRAGREALDRFRKKTEEFASQESRPISSQVFQWTPEKWIVYEIE